MIQIGNCQLYNHNCCDCCLDELQDKMSVSWLGIVFYDYEFIPSQMYFLEVETVICTSLHILMLTCLIQNRLFEMCFNFKYLVHRLFVLGSAVHFRCPQLTA